MRGRREKIHGRQIRQFCSRLHGVKESSNASLLRHVNEHSLRNYGKFVLALVEILPSHMIEGIYFHGKYGKEGRLREKGRMR